MEVSVMEGSHEEIQRQMHESTNGKIETPASTGNFSREHVKQYFDDSKNYLDIRRYIIDVRAEAIKQFIGERKLNRMLDVGCGDGSISLPLLSSQNRLTLLDLSPKMLERARRLIPPELLKNVRAINGEFLSSSLDSGAYDLVLCIGVLAHVESPRKAIERAASLLAPGGMLILECTDADNFTNELTVILSRIRALLSRAGRYRTRLNSASEVIQLATSQGLTLTSTYRYNVALPLMGKVFSQAALRALIRLLYGTPQNNRNRWLGKECLLVFTKPLTDADNGI